MPPETWIMVSTRPISSTIARLNRVMAMGSACGTCPTPRSITGNHRSGSTRTNSAATPETMSMENRLNSTAARLVGASRNRLTCSRASRSVCSLARSDSSS